MKKLGEKIIAYQNKNTPAFDKLAHYYWGNEWWSFLGSVIAILVLAIVKLFLTVPFWYCLPVVVLPYVSALFFATQKEKRDATGLGNSEKADIKFTVKPAFIQMLFLIVIIIFSL